MASFTGKGHKARLFVDEVKNVSRVVDYDSLRTLGANWNKALRGAIKKVDESILIMFSKSEIDEVTKKCLLSQLRQKTFTIRLVPGPDARFTKEIVKMLKDDLPHAIIKIDPLR